MVGRRGGNVIWAGTGPESDRHNAKLHRPFTTQEYDTDKMLTVHGFGGKVDGRLRFVFCNNLLVCECLWVESHVGGSISL